VFFFFFEIINFIVNCVCLCMVFVFFALSNLTTENAFE